MSSKKEKFARVGIASKGVIYVLVGGLTALAAFNLGGQKTGSRGALQYIAQQSFGQILLILTALGLLGYVFWRFYQVIENPKNHKNDAKGIISRIAYAFSGLFYGLLAYTAIKLAFNAGSGSGNNWVSTLFSSENGTTYAIIIGIILLGKAIYELYMAYSNKYKEDLQEAKINDKVRNLLITWGRIGFTARGLVAGVLSYMTLKAGFTAGNSSLQGKEDAFTLIKAEFGTTIMGILALGLLGYGIFMFVRARYSSVAVT